MIALGNALAATLAQRRAFTAEEFASYHPAGSLGLTCACRINDADRRRLASRQL